MKPCGTTIYKLSPPHYCFRLETIPSSVFLWHWLSLFILWIVFLCLKLPLSLSFKSWNWKSHTFAIGISQLTIIIWTVPFQNLMDDLQPKSRTYLIFPSLCLWHHLSLAHRQSRTYQQWQSFAIPCKKVKGKGKSLTWIRGFIGFHK